MLEWAQTKFAAILLGVACLAAPGAASAAKPVDLSGAITGVVLNPGGVRQMGAVVTLFDHQNRVYGRVLTDDHGEFRFLGLFPDTYSLRVTLAAFIPAFQPKVLVRAGLRSVLAVNLSTLFSSVRIAYPSLDNGNVMTDDWRWMLRGSSATRPGLRFAGVRPGTPPGPQRATFSEMRGLLRVSGGDGGRSAGVASEADMGTAFALATSFAGASTLEFSGNVGYGSQTGSPVAAFRTSYRPAEGSAGPDVSLTVRQLYSGNRSADLAAADPTAPLLRALSASFADSMEVWDGWRLRYGAALDSVYFINHVSYLSPYAELSYRAGDTGQFSFAFSSGNARPELGRTAMGEGDLQSGLDDLSRFPRISARGGRGRIQRGTELEASYQRRAGSRSFVISAFREQVRDAAIGMRAEGLALGGDVVQDLFTGNQIFNAGNYATTGFSGAMVQELGPHVTASILVGSLGALTLARSETAGGDAEELRALIRTGRKLAATARVAATLPASGAELVASYQWTDRRASMPGNLYSTQAIRQIPGLNFYARQPLPLISGRPLRVELTADLRNLLAQGYLPLTTPGAGGILLVQYPRSLRGGLNFIF